MRYALAGLMLCFVLPASAAGLLRNGGFERGSFAWWQMSGNTAYSEVFSQTYDGLNQEFGRYYALLGARSTPVVLSQSFRDAPGAKLLISFWLATDGAGQTDSFDVLFNGKVVQHVGASPAFGWTEYHVRVHGTGRDTLSISARNDTAYWALDRVEVRTGGT